MFIIKETMRKQPNQITRKRITIKPALIFEQPDSIRVGTLSNEAIVVLSTPASEDMICKRNELVKMYVQIEEWVSGELCGRVVRFRIS